MTEVTFHFNVPDRIDYACRLLRKAYASGNRVGVVADEFLLQELDQRLWTFSALEFIPHCRGHADAAMRAASPVVLAASCGEIEHSDVLVQLGDEPPAGFERFERLIELVGLAPEERQQARLRWRHYADRGYEIKTHDVAAMRNQ